MGCCVRDPAVGESRAVSERGVGRRDARMGGDAGGTRNPGWPAGRGSLRARGRRAEEVPAVWIVGHVPLPVLMPARIARSRAFAMRTEASTLNPPEPFQVSMSAASRSSRSPWRRK